MYAKRIIIASFLLFTLSLSQKLEAQNLDKYFVPYYEMNGEIKEFEKESAKAERQTIGLGYGGINEYLTIFKKKQCDLRFKKNELPVFLVKVEEGTETLELVVVVKADKVKGNKTYRKFIQKGYNAAGGAKDIGKYIEVPGLKKRKGEVYEIIFDETLEAGEYSFQPIYKGEEASNIVATSGSVRIYCFGIDD